jgi:hypothetical protein
MMEDSRISLKKSIKPTIRVNLMLLDSGTNIDLLMIWLPTLLSQKVDSSGLVKTTMVMFNLMLLPKDMDHLV